MGVEITRIFQHTMPKHINTTTVFPSETTCPISGPTLRPLALAARLTCAVLLGAALPAQVMAQSTTAEVNATLPTATVVGRGETAKSPGKGFVAKQSSAGTKTDTPIIETPQSISVITQQQLEDQRPRGLSEALNYTTGAFTGLVGAANRYDYVALRGFNDRAAIAHSRSIRLSCSALTCSRGRALFCSGGLRQGASCRWSAKSRCSSRITKSSSR